MKNGLVAAARIWYSKKGSWFFMESLPRMEFKTQEDAEVAACHLNELLEMFPYLKEEINSFKASTIFKREGY